MNRWIFDQNLPELAALPLGLIALVATLRSAYCTAAAAAAGASVVGTPVVWLPCRPFRFCC